MTFGKITLARNIFLITFLFKHDTQIKPFVGETYPLLYLHYKILEGNSGYTDKTCISRLMNTFYMLKLYKQQMIFLTAIPKKTKKSLPK